jgi:hypothetical protein
MKRPRYCAPYLRCSTPETYPDATLGAFLRGLGFVLVLIIVSFAVKLLKHGEWRKEKRSSLV